MKLVYDSAGTRRRRRLVLNPFTMLEETTTPTSSGSSAEFHSLVSLLFDLFASEAVVGQYSLEYIQSDYACSYHAPIPGEENFHVSAPLSSRQAFESAVNHMNVTFDTPGVSTSIGLVSMNTIVVDADVNADALLVQISDPSWCTSRNCSFSIEFPHYNQLDDLNVTTIMEIIPVECALGIGFFSSLYLYSLSLSLSLSLSPSLSLPLNVSQTKIPYMFL